MDYKQKYYDLLGELKRLKTEFGDCDSEKRNGGIVGRQKLVATWECVVTEVDGDSVWCDAYPLGGGEDDEIEFWEVEVPGNKWTEGHVFYVLRSR